MSTVVDADGDDLESPTEQVLESNGRDALRPVHDLADELEPAARVRDWILADQSRDAVDEVPTADDVIDVLEAADAPRARVVEPENGFGYVTTRERDWYRYSVVTDDEQVRAIAEIERRDRDDVRFTRTVVDEWRARDWIRLAIETGRLELVSTEPIAVFDDLSTFTGGSA